MGPITTIQFNDALPVDCKVILSWTASGGTPTSATEKIKTTRTTYFQTQRGVDAISQAQNYAYALSLDYSANIEVTRDGNLVYIRSINSTSSIVGEATCDGYVTYYPYVYSAPQDIRVRSPYLFIKTNPEFDTIKYDIKVYEGLFNDNDSFPITYTKTKQKVVPTQENIFINLSPLLREDLTSSITNFLVQEYNYTLPLIENESKWVYVEYTPFFLFEPVTEPSFNYFFAIDGYIEASETQGLPNVLKTNFRKTISRNSFEKIFFKTKNIYDISYTSPGYGEFSVDLSNIGDTNDNKEYVHSISVHTNSFDNANIIIYKIQYMVGGEDIVYTLTYDIYDECKYDNYDLVFKNKYGVLDSLALTKKLSKTLNVKSTDYLRSIVDYNGDFDITKHTNKQMSTKGTEEWTLNTDFLPEYMNEVITEAMLSEEMWLVKWVFKGEPVVIPVTRLDNSISYKTHLNDKLIQYTVKVKLSHDKINNIQ